MGELHELSGSDGIEIHDTVGADESNSGAILKIAYAIVMYIDGLIIEPDVAACTDMFGEVDHHCNGGTS